MKRAWPPKPRGGRAPLGTSSENIIHVRLPPELSEELNSYVNSLDNREWLTKSEVVRLALVEYLEKEER